MWNTYFWVDWNNNDAGVMVTQLLPFADERVAIRQHGEAEGMGQA